VTEPSDRRPEEGDELWFGLVGPIRVSDEITPERAAWAAAGRVAQAAHSLSDLTGLVTSHADPRVRYEAIPRLRARFPDESQTLKVLTSASQESNAMVRDAAVMALSDLHGPAAADVIAARLQDEDFEVRLSATHALASLGDVRAPAEPDAWALESMVTGEEADE
jgi:HEAT repeat protein